MNKDYPRDCLKVFDVLKNDVIVFTGTAREIADKLDISDYCLVSLACRDHYKLKSKYLKSKYLIRLRGYRCFVFEIESIKTNEKFTGTAQDIADKLFLVDKGYVVRTAKKSKLLCGEWKIRFLDRMIETA